MLNKGQSHVECDVSNLNYNLDYKLFVDTKLMESISLLSHQYVISKDKSTVMLCGSKKEDLKDEYDSSLITLLKNCEKDKNIYFYLQYTIYFKDKIINEEMANKDTCISFVTNNYMVIAKENNGKLELYDIVSLDCSDTYKEIIYLTSTWC